MQTIGIGMIGSGFMGLTYSEVVAKHATGCRLAAITGGRRAGQLAADYGVPAEPTVDSLLARDDVQAVVLATPDQDRMDLTRRAAAAGKHVLAEKPMAPTVAECDQMIAACAAAGVTLAVVKTERFRKLTQRARALIDDGTTGPIQMLRTVSAFPLPLTKSLFDKRQWMLDPRGGEFFRFTGTAQGPAGTFYMTDRGFNSYERHGRGRLWKLEIEQSQAKWIKPTTEPVTDAACLAQQLREGKTKLSTQQLCEYARGSDAYFADAALTALARETATWTTESLRALPDNERVWALVALRRVDLQEEEWVRVLLRSTDQGRNWTTVENFRAVPDIDTAEGRYLTVLTDGRLLVTWCVGTANKDCVTTSPPTMAALGTTTTPQRCCRKSSSRPVTIPLGPCNSMTSTSGLSSSKGACPS
jgi:hypothetical protein